MSKHIDSRWQGGNAENPLRLWAHQPGGSVIIANFDVSKHLRHETKKANCRYARAAMQFVDGTSVEQIERLNALELNLSDVLTRMRMLRALVDTSTLGGQAMLTIEGIDKVLG